MVKLSVLSRWNRRCLEWQTSNLLRRESWFRQNVKLATKHTVLKKANAAIAENAENKDALVKAAVKTIDQACAKGIIHKNCAARKKSTLAALAK